MTLNIRSMRDIEYSCSSYSSVLIGMSLRVSGEDPRLTTLTVRMSPISTAYTSPNWMVSSVHCFSAIISPLFIFGDMLSPDKLHQKSA